MFVMYRPDQDVWAYGVEPAKVRYRLRLARYPALAEYLRDWIAQRPRQKLQLLDIGAGFGRTFLYLEAAGIAEHFRLNGIDIDPMRKNDVYTGGDWEIQRGDAEQPLAFENHSLDVVVCEQLLEHLEHPDRLLAEVHRVLKPDGLFVCGVPTFIEPAARVRRWLIKRFGLRGSNHIQTYSLRSIRQDVAPWFSEETARGFRVVSGGLLRGLENHAWWYRFNRSLGEWLPGLCIEVQLMLTPRSDPTLNNGFE
jgi:SAM-dependent methyltransferase